MNKDQILNSLNIKGYFEENVSSIRWNGLGVGIAKCPFHDDRNPSLSIKLSTGQFKCFGCDSKGSLFDFHMKLHNVDYKTAKAALAVKSGLITEQKRRIFKTYDYTDESGMLLFQSIRYEPKGFRQRRPDGNGGWIYNLNGVDTVPYNLPEILSAKDVAIVEGEKDVETLRSLGLAASCNPMGAGKWRVEYNRYFKDKNVIIIPDNDIPGKKHAGTVARNLKDVAVSVKVIELPDLSDKGDLSDWIAQGGTKEDLLQLFKQAPMWEEKVLYSEEEPWPELIPLEDFTRLPKFPTIALPKWAREMVEAVSEVVQVDPGLPGSLILAVLATCLQKKAQVYLRTHTEPVNIYVCPVLDSGERKSSAMRIMTAPLYEYQRDEVSRKIPTIQENRTKRKILETRLTKLQNQAACCKDKADRLRFETEALDLTKEIANQPPFMEPVHIVDDITSEALASVMADNGECMSLISAEGGIFEIMAGLYKKDSSENIDIFLKGHTGDPFSSHRIGRETKRMESPTLTVCLSVQNEVIRVIGSNRKFRERGLLARFLFSLCAPQAGRRKRQSKSMPTALVNEYANKIKALMDIPLGPHTLTLAPEAQIMWDQFYDEIEMAMSPGKHLWLLKDWSSKLPGAVARIASLLHIAEYGMSGLNTPISVGIVGDSVKLGKYYLEHALVTFGLMGEDPRIKAAKLILEYVEAHSLKNFKVRDIVRNKSYFKTSEDVNPGLNILVERGYIRPMAAKPSTGGRPEGISYEVHPHIKNSETSDNTDKSN